jgi:DNA-binding NtrC family response regulator
MKKVNKGNVLVVDDDMRLLSTLSSILKDNGFRVFTAATGQEAIEVFRNSFLDAVILDLLLPDTDGISLLKIFHSEKPLLTAGSWGFTVPPYLVKSKSTGSSVTNHSSF